MTDNVPPDNVLGAASLSKIIAAILPRGAKPQIRSSFDAIALGAHASFLAVGFRLVGLGEDHRIEQQSSVSSTSPETDSSSEQHEQHQQLPESWNSHLGHYAFRYKHNQSSMEYLLQVNRMASKAIILAMGLGDDKTANLEIIVQDFVSDGNLPASPTADLPSDPAEIRRTINNVFISVGRLSDLGSMMRIKVIQKLIPGLSKAGYVESSDSTISSPAGTTSRDTPAQSNRADPLREDRSPPGERPYMPLQDPFVQPPHRRPMPEPMPGFEDEHEILRPPRGGLGGLRGPRIGDSDLYPAGLGPNDPFRGGMGPNFGGPMGGGMHPTFDDPLFAGQGQGSGGFDPQAPPGSRYDPIGPGSGHPRRPGMGGRPPNPFGGFGDGDFI